MTTQPSFSTHKIVILLAFLCAAIMMSVFIFHWRHQPQTVIALENGSLFPVTRDIKPFELVGNEQAFTQKNLLNHWTLVFFGFTHCSNVCPATLDMMSKAYPQLKQDIPNLQVLLVSLDPDRDTPAAISAYTRGFHPDFIGATAGLQALHKIQSQFNIYSAPDTSNSGQIQHTASIMLLNPKGQWVALFHYGMAPKEFTHEVKQVVGFLAAG